MALCTSCGNQVDEAASFCTSCGKPMPAAAAPSAAVTVARPACSSCGVEADPDSVFCTECGKRLGAEPVPVAEAVPTGAATALPAVKPVPATPANAEPPKPSVAAERAVILPASTPVETAHAAAAVEASIDHEPLQPAPQLAAPVYAMPSDFPPERPGAGAFRIIVLVLLLLIVIGGLGGWYFTGVETVIVCSPPDVTVFLDGKELAPASYGRYVIPHLPRQPHMLRVQRTGFADTIERLDFPLTSLHEWVNIKLVPRRPTRFSSPR